MKKISILLLAILQLTIFTSCKNTETNSDKLQVYTSFYAMYDFAKEIGQDKADIYLMCPASQESHDFEPSAQDIAKLSEADIFIYNGMEMEHWADSVTATLGENVAAVCTSDGINSKNKDPHVWLNPDNAYVQYKAIADAFKEKDAENADYYDAKLKECKEKLDKLKADCKSASAEFNNTNIIVSHDAYSHFCDLLNVEQYAINGTDNSGDPTPSRMAEIEDFIADNNIKCIFAEPMGTSDIVKTIANDTGCDVLVLDPFEGSLDNTDYFTVMYKNLDAVKKALN